MVVGSDAVPTVTDSTKAFPKMNSPNPASVAGATHRYRAEGSLPSGKKSGRNTRSRTSEAAHSQVPSHAPHPAKGPPAADTPSPITPSAKVRPKPARIKPTGFSGSRHTR